LLCRQSGGGRLAGSDVRHDLQCLGGTLGWQMAVWGSYVRFMELAGRVL